MQQVQRVMFMVAMVAVGAAALVPGVGAFVIAPALALLLGLTGGWWGVQTGAATALRLGMRAGLATGLGALLGVVLCLAATALVDGGSAAVTELLRGNEPAAAARSVADLAASGLPGVVLAGGLLGLGLLAVAELAGLVAGLVVHDRRLTPAP